mgnify:FL=1
MNDRTKAQLLWQSTKGFRPQLAIAIGAMSLGYIFMFGVPLVMKFAIDMIGAIGADSNDFAVPGWVEFVVASIFSDGKTPEASAFAASPANILPYLVLCAIAIVCLTMMAGLFLYIRGRSMAFASEGIIRSLRDRVYTHIEHLPSRYHDEADTGDLVQRCTSDMETIRVFLSGQIIEISRAILMLIVVLPILFSLDTNMAWLSLAVMPLLFISAIIFFRKVKALFQVVDEAEASLTTVLQENLTGIRVVRAFAQQQFEINKFASENAQFRDHNTRLIGLLGIYYGFSDLLCLGQIGLILLVGAQWVLTGDLTVGTLFAFLTYESMIIWPIRHMGRVLTDSGKAIVSMGRLSEILLEPVESQNEDDPGKRLTGRIEVRDLSYGFETENNVLNDMTFSVEAGQTLALLGPPGSGKSTLAQLLMRLYDYKHGSIALDDIELMSLARKYVRAQISIVLQEPFLYSASIGGNLQVGRMDATQAEIIEAAQQAAIHESILAFPRGYDSQVGERGVTLSGGQRQRIALARALLKKPPILILDDALSAVDTDTESKILQTLKAQRNTQTTIIIAHRLSTVMHADKILMLEAGHIVQEGTHETLSQQPGIYRNLCTIQGNLQQQLEQDIDHSSDTEATGAGRSNRRETTDV